jgi:hypothetical protein
MCQRVPFANSKTIGSRHANDGGKRSWARLAVVACLVACSSNERVDDEAARWESAQPDRYVVQTCTLGHEPAGCIRAAVEDGEAVAADERIFAAGVGWEEFDASRSPLDDMFDRVREGDTNDCELEDVVYDRSFGFVESYELNCGASTEWGRWVACFEPDTLELAMCDVVPAM